MSRTRRSFLLVPVMFAIGLASGCAGTANREFAAELRPLVGKADKAYFLEKYGDPDKRTAVDLHTDMWEYSFGQQSLNDFGARGNLSTGTRLRLTFKDGILSSWQAANTVR